MDRLPGEAQRYFVDTNQGFVYLNNRYWFDFDTWSLRRPSVSAAYGGRHPRISERNCAFRAGTAVVTKAPLDEGQEISITVGGGSLPGEASRRHRKQQDLRDHRPLRAVKLVGARGPHDERAMAPRRINGYEA